MALTTPDMGADRLLIVDSVTGVDVSVPVAGTGARALAFLMDLLIRSVLVVTWYVIATIIHNGRWNLAAPLDPQASWYLYVALPTAGIFTLYHCVLEIAMRGRTPGKRMVGVRIVTRNGAAPSVAAHLVRNVFRLVDSFPLGYGVGLITTMITRDHIRIGDLAAGTLLVYDTVRELGRAHFVASTRDPRLDSDTAELSDELLQRWNTLAVEARDRLARALLTRVANEPSGSAADDAALNQRLRQLVGGASASPIS